MSHSTNKPRRPLLFFRYIELNHRIYKVPSLFEAPRTPPSQQYERVIFSPRIVKGGRGTEELNQGTPLRNAAVRRSRIHRSDHRQKSRSIRTERSNSRRQNGPASYHERSGQGQEGRPAGPTMNPKPSHASSQGQPIQACDRLEAMRPLPLLQSRASLPVESRRFSQSNNEDGQSNGTRDVSATCAISSEPLTDYVLANEDDYLPKDDSESPDATSSEPWTDYVLANENDYIARDHSDYEVDM